MPVAQSAFQRRTGTRHARERSILVVGLPAASEIILVEARTRCAGNTAHSLIRSYSDAARLQAIRRWRDDQRNLPSVSYELAPSRPESLSSPIVRSSRPRYIEAMSKSVKSWMPKGKAAGRSAASGRSAVTGVSTGKAAATTGDGRDRLSRGGSRMRRPRRHRLQPPSQRRAGRPSPAPPHATRCATGRSSPRCGRTCWTARSAEASLARSDPTA